MQLLLSNANDLDTNDRLTSIWLKKQKWMSNGASVIPRGGLVIRNSCEMLAWVSACMWQCVFCLFADAQVCVRAILICKVCVFECYPLCILPNSLSPLYLYSGRQAGFFVSSPEVDSQSPIYNSTAE